MKKWFTNPQVLFTLLAVASLLSIAGGVYLGCTLGLSDDATLNALCLTGMVLWAAAWAAFLAMCLRLRTGTTAFTHATGTTLAVICGCMVLLAGVTAASAHLGSAREVGFLLIEMVLLPGFFLAVGVAALVLQRLLVRAMDLEHEQEGVV